MSPGGITSAYPASPADRTRWIVRQRGVPNKVAADKPYSFFSEEERMKNGEIANVSTIFLTNRECPWRCLICDLWRNTAPVSPGSVPRQIEYALSRLAPAAPGSVLKLYNSGSFFDVGAIPRSDWNDIAALCLPFEHLIVECHPRLVGPDILIFAEMFEGQIEIAMGLETCNPPALEKINKRITLQDFTRAARFLRRNGIDIRTFLLVSVPFIRESEQEHWVRQSINTAFDADSDVVSLIPARAGNGALDALQVTGDFREPMLRDLEDAHDYGVGLQRGRVFADTWDLARFSGCPDCANERDARLERMNQSQAIEPRICCTCGT